MDHKTIQILDIGGSGVKSVRVESSRDVERLTDLEMKRYATPEWKNFANWALREVLLQSDTIAIACADSWKKAVS